MRILYIYSEISIKGGTDRVLVEKANYLATHGYDVTIVTEAQLGRELSFPINPAVKHIDMGLDFNRQYKQGVLGRVWTYFTLMREYKKRLKEVLLKEKPDIVISIMGRSLDFIAEMNDGSVKIVEAHTTKSHLRSLHLMEERGGLYKYAARYLRRKMCRNVSKLDAIVVLTQQDANDWKEAKRVVVIPNAVPFDTEEISSLNNKQVIMVGRYNDAKGYDYLIPAWDIVHQKHPDWTLHVYGSGELHDQVVRWIQERHLEDTIILHEPVNNIMEKYLESSIAVLSSRYEGFSLVLLEAMSCGVPFVSFDCPYCPRNIIRDGEDGLLVEYLSSQALADGICRMIEDDSLRRRLGTKAKENIKRFSKESVMRQWKDLFESLTQMETLECGSLYDDHSEQNKENSINNQENNMDYKVTIGIPVYNIVKYIRPMLDSALSQTFQDIEFLICDDCGTDGSMDIVREYQQTHPRGKDIRVLRQPHNMGIGEGRNRMMAEAHGKFFYSLDGDDTIEPNTIELLYNAAMEHHAEMVHGSFDRVYVENDKIVRAVPYPYPAKVFTQTDEYAEYAYTVGVEVMNWNFLLDMDVIRRNNLRVTPVGHGYGEDFTYTVDLPTYVTRVVLLPNITYHYYMRKTDIKVKRTHPISRKQMDLAIDAIDKKKRRSELRSKSYYARRCSVLLMYDYSFACRILAKGDDIDVPYTKTELRNIMWHPMTLREILCSRQVRMKNLGYWLLGVLPPALSVFMIKISAKLIHRL